MRTETVVLSTLQPSASEREITVADASPVRHDVQMKTLRQWYEIRVAMASDAGSSVVYLFDPKAATATRIYLRIKPRRGRALWCEGIINDWNYRRRYDEDRDRKAIAGVPTLVLGGWYRHLLRIERSSSGELPKTYLKIKLYRRAKWTWAGLWGSIRVSQQHPVSTNRIAMNLALLGAALGIISLISPFIHP